MVGVLDAAHRGRGIPQAFTVTGELGHNHRKMKRDLRDCPLPRTIGSQMDIKLAS